MATPTSSVPSTIPALEQRLDALAASQETIQKTLDDAGRTFDDASAQHVAAVFPPLRQLAGAARYLWADMLDAPDGDGPDEADVEPLLRALETSLTTFEAGIAPLLDGTIHEKDARIERAVDEAGDAQAQAEALWADLAKRRIPAANALLRAKMDDISRQERTLAGLCQSLEDEMGKDDVLANKKLPNETKTTDGLKLDPVRLDPTTSNRGADASDWNRVLSQPRQLRDLRDQLARDFAEHQTQAAEVTRLVCEGTTAKVVRDELRVQVHVVCILAQRHAATYETLKTAHETAASLLGDVRDLLGKLEWTDVNDEGAFPSEELLVFAARVLGHVVRFCDESRRADVEDVLVAIRGSTNGSTTFASSSRKPNPPQVVEILNAIDPTPVEVPVAKPATKSSESPKRDPTERQQPKAEEARLDRSLRPQPTVEDEPRPDLRTNAPPHQPVNPLLEAVRSVTQALQDLPTPHDATGPMHRVDPMPIPEEANAAPPREPAQLRILGASWGGRDVTDILQRRVRDNKLTIDMRNMHTVLGDPLPYKYKHLTGLYSYGPDSPPRLFILSEQLPFFSSGIYVIRPEDDPSRSHQQQQTERVSVPAGEAWRAPDGTFEILSVTYGPRHVRNQAVFKTLEDYFLGKRDSIVPGNTFFRIDPWQNNVKTWTVFVRFAGEGGAVRCVTGREDKGLEGPWASRQ